MQELQGHSMLTYLTFLFASMSKTLPNFFVDKLFNGEFAKLKLTQTVVPVTKNLRLLSGKQSKKQVSTLLSVEPDTEFIRVLDN